MKYEEKKKLIDAANLLKEHCEKNIREKECDCPFDFGDDGICSIGDLCPDAWEVPKIKRWTPEDVALAKALKSFGVTSISRNADGNIVIGTALSCVGILKMNAFFMLCQEDSIGIDEIIKEAEE